MCLILQSENLKLQSDCRCDTSILVSTSSGSNVSMNTQLRSTGFVFSVFFGTHLESPPTKTDHPQKITRSNKWVNDSVPTGSLIHESSTLSRHSLSQFFPFSRSVYRPNNYTVDWGKRVVFGGRTSMSILDFSTVFVPPQFNDKRGVVNGLKNCVLLSLEKFLDFIFSVVNSSRWNVLKEGWSPRSPAYTDDFVSSVNILIPRPLTPLTVCRTVP
jgi:hypothetical protein